MKGNDQPFSVSFGNLAYVEVLLNCAWPHLRTVSWTALDKVLSHRPCTMPCLLDKAQILVCHAGWRAGLGQLQRVYGLLPALTPTKQQLGACAVCLAAEDSSWRQQIGRSGSRAQPRSRRSNVQADQPRCARPRRSRSPLLSLAGTHACSEGACMSAMYAMFWRWGCKAWSRRALKCNIEGRYSAQAGFKIPGGHCVPALQQGIICLVGMGCCGCDLTAAEHGRDMLPACQAALHAGGCLLPGGVAANPDQDRTVPSLPGKSRYSPTLLQVRAAGRGCWLVGTAAFVAYAKRMSFLLQARAACRSCWCPRRGRRGLLWAAPTGRTMQSTPPQS